VSESSPPEPPSSADKPDDVADDLAKIPRLPRAGGFKLATADLVKIGFTAAILIMIIMIRRPCSETVSNFVIDIDNPGSGSAGTQMPKPDNLDPSAGSGSSSTAPLRDPCEVNLAPNMTDAETRAAIERAQACAAARKTTGSAGSAGSGSASGSAEIRPVH
jgi:hypothetical protein